MSIASHYRVDTRTAQATGMVAAQADCSMATAVILMNMRAELIGCGLRTIAVAVEGRRMRFARGSPEKIFQSPGA